MNIKLRYYFLTLALLLAWGSSVHASSVHLNADGHGQVLIYPYYTVREGNDTFISVVNNTSQAKSVRVRFIEGVNNRIVRSFNLYLSAFDTWVAALTANGDNVDLLIPDSSCTVPYFFGSEAFSIGDTEADRVGVLDFTDVLFTGDFADAGPATEERVQSGYIEMIEMGTLVDDTQGSATAVSHVLVDFGDVELPRPRNCQQLSLAWIVDSSFNGYWTDDASIDHEPPSGGLQGAGTIINVGAGTMFTYKAEAIDGFSTQVLHGRVNSSPTLNSGNVFTSSVSINGVVDTRTWSSSVEAVSATLMHDRIWNEFIIDPALAALSEWVVTLPTKGFYTDSIAPIGELPVAPFRTTDNENCESNQSPEAGYSNLRFLDRESAPTHPPILLPCSTFCPPEPEPIEATLCNGANVIRLSADQLNDSGSKPEHTEILGEPRFLNLPIGNTGFTTGWAQIDLTFAGDALRFTRSTVDDTGAPTGIAYVGQPVTGFWINTFTNGALQGGAVLANYGGTIRHSGSRRFGEITEEQP